MEIRHGRCRALLHEVTEPPADWSGTLDVPSCTRCGRGRPGRGRFARWAAGRGPAPLATLAHRVRWEELRPAVDRARATGRVQTETIT
ncbi:MAG: hypothetical protein GEV12_08635 [Micromonosporaceae bacterium]|nr:hypothetical protein [Micromonosporaceae bacterium]